LDCSQQIADLNSEGVQGTLLVKNGFTHYPQKQEERRFFPGAREMPSRILVLDGNGSITFDVLGWLSEQGVPLIRVDWRGNVTTVVSNSYGPDPRLVKAHSSPHNPKSER
jgi:CRISPR-associated protein Cas1